MSGAIETQGTKLGIKAETETVSATFDATNGTITRAAGDWTAKFAPGMIVTTTDPGNPGPYVVMSLTNTEMVVAGQTRGYAGQADFASTADPVMTTDAVAASFAFTAYKTIGEIVNFDGPGGEANEKETTNLDSAAKEILLGLPDEGSISFDLNFVPGNPGQVAFRAARKKREKKGFVLMFPDATDTAIATNAIFEGFAKSWSVSGGVDDKASAKAAIRITGAVDWSDEE